MTSRNATDYTGFVRHDKDGRNSLRLAIEGMNCAGCAFKIERALNANENVDARVNVTEKRLTLIWKGDARKGNDLIDSATSLGFRFSPVREKDPQTETYTRELLRALAVAGFSSGNLMIFSLALWFSTRETMGGSTRDMMHWYSALIALPTVVYSGMPFFRSAWHALRNWRTNMDVPISVAVVLTSAMSLFETVRGGQHVYFDSAVMLLFLLLAGRYLDAKARAQTRNAAADLMSLMSGSATVILEDGSDQRIPAADIRPGMTLRVAKGEKILADGNARTDALVDASAISGETLPQNIPAGGRVLAGMVNLGPGLSVRVEKSQDDSLMGDIIALMQKAEQGHARYVRLADKIAGWYTPAVHAIAAAAFFGWWIYGGIPWQQALLVAITVLVITCPCALGLAVPVAHVVAGKRLFKNGMLLKSDDALERLARIDTVIFDKTGTLTSGAISFENAEDFTADELALAASLASASRHPLAVAAAQVSARRIPLRSQETEGKGVEAQQNGETVRLGSAAFTGAQAADDEKMELWLDTGSGTPKRLAFSDLPHDDARATIAEIAKTCNVIMLSGDRLPAARHIADLAGIADVRAGATPKQKYAVIENEIIKGRHVLMVGDGLNDAAALTRASVSMSPSTALDITQNAADIVYRRKGIVSVRQAIETARKTQNVVRQNFALALGYNAVAIPLAVFGQVTPLVAAIAMSASSLAVIFNALRIGKE